MKPIIQTIVLLLAFNIVNAQLVDTLTINTGYDNTTSDTVQTGASDPNWAISALTAPATAHNNQTLPYNAYTDSTWVDASAPKPVTPMNTKWIVHSPGAMGSGITDDTGKAEVTFNREFEICDSDTIVIDIRIRSDNRVTDLSIDGISTGFNQQPIDNWISGSIFTDTLNNLAAGKHHITITTKNGPQAPGKKNAIGINVIGKIFSFTGSNSIIDRENYPSYDCETNNVSALNINGWHIQNHPNPFQNNTIISYQLPFFQNSANILIRNIEGKTIATFNINKPGTGSINLNADDYSAGVYFYSLIVDGQSLSTKKMIIVE